MQSRSAVCYTPQQRTETGFDGLARANLGFRKGGPQTRRSRRRAQVGSKHHDRGRKNSRRLGGQREPPHGSRARGAMAERKSVLSGLASGQNSADPANFGKLKKQADIFTADCDPDCVARLVKAFEKADTADMAQPPRDRDT
jgi:hypothetical protein